MWNGKNRNVRNGQSSETMPDRLLKESKNPKIMKKHVDNEGDSSGFFRGAGETTSGRSLK